MDRALKTLSIAASADARPGESAEYSEAETMKWNLPHRRGRGLEWAWSRRAPLYTEVAACGRGPGKDAERRPGVRGSSSLQTPSTHGPRSGTLRACLGVRDVLPYRSRLRIEVGGRSM